VFPSSLRTKPGKDPANELAGFAVRRQAIVAPNDGRLGVAGRQGVALRGREGAAPPRHRLVQRPEKSIVGKVGWSDDTVWIDAVKPNKAAADAEVTGSVGFRGAHEGVWNFHIGGYQVCEKWLKDRTLTAEDIAHYHRIVIALHETIRLMREIDDVIEAHGWPGAFQRYRRLGGTHGARPQGRGAAWGVRFG